MRVYNQPRFDEMLLQLLKDFDGNAEEVDGGSWQSTDIRGDRSKVTRELREASLVIQMPANEGEAQRVFRPNLPWAEDHFQERVSGIPHNPPPSQAWWPFAQNGNADHKKPRSLEIDDRGWAYLAAMVDGDGSITMHRRYVSDPGRPRVSISQKDHDFIRELGRRYPFGSISSRVREDVKTPDGKIRRSNAATWYVHSKAKCRFVLEGILPHLILKEKKAREALEALDQLRPHHSDKPWVVPGEPQFSHTYPERFWPKYAGGAELPRRGIRFEYGDLDDVIERLIQNPLTRQAYLPIWGQEDTGAPAKERVPCTLGYLFMIRNRKLHVTYHIRSCDFMRHWRDDVYMAVRLGQWISTRPGLLEHQLEMGELTMHIGSFHIFEGDRAMVKHMLRTATRESNQELLRRLG